MVMPERHWTISNFLSLSRILLAIPVVFLINSGDPDNRWWALGLIIVAALTDIFDGLIARHLNQVTEFGRIIDPLADKFAIIIVGIVLTIRGLSPLWFLIALAGRDLIILVGGLYIKNLTGKTLPSNLAGKWTSTFIALYILCVVIDLPQISSLKIGLLIISTVMLIISFFLYAQRFVSVVRNKPSKLHRMPNETWE